MHKIYLYCKHIKMPNKLALQAFKQLKVYSRLSVPLLLNEMACNRVMKLNPLVDAAPTIYKTTSRLLGKNFVNAFINATYCKIFTAGNTIKEADSTSNYFRSQGVPVIIDYCAEGDITSPDLEGTLIENGNLFAESANLISKQQNEMISIKMTGLLDMRIIKKWNEAVELRDKFWEENSRNGKISFDSLSQGLKKIIPNLPESQIIQYIKTLHNNLGEASSFSIDELNFKNNHHPYYVFDQNKNRNNIIKAFFPINEVQQQKIKDFRERIILICQPHIKNETNFRILVDAEQSYVQKAIEVISQQLQERYNKDRAYIIPTIQNYLKRSVERGQFEIKLAKLKNLKFGAKLVRGAYIVEETRLANKFGYQNPVVNQFEFTTQNYLTNFKNILDSFHDGEVIVATHNQDTISEAIKIKNAHPNPPTVSFAQLLGLADHLTWDLKGKGLPVYKYLPWAETEVMVPYMIRRAQELNQMKYPLDIQYELLKDELWSRIKLV